MEEGVNDITEDKNEKKDEEKEAEFLYNTYPVEMEGGASDRKNDKSEKMMRRKRQNA